MHRTEEAGGGRGGGAGVPVANDPVRRIDRVRETIDLFCLRQMPVSTVAKKVIDHLNARNRRRLAGRGGPGGRGGFGGRGGSRGGFGGGRGGGGFGGRGGSFGGMKRDFSSGGENGNGEAANKKIKFDDDDE